MSGRSYNVYLRCQAVVQNCQKLLVSVPCLQCCSCCMPPLSPAVPPSWWLSDRKDNLIEYKHLLSWLDLLEDSISWSREKLCNWVKCAPLCTVWLWIICVMNIYLLLYICSHRGSDLMDGRRECVKLTLLWPNGLITKHVLWITSKSSFCFYQIGFD